MNLRQVAATVDAWLAKSHRIKTLLRKHGPTAIESRLREGGSLRQLAERVGLSPTYLSNVRTGKDTISPAAFVKLVKGMPCQS